MQVRLDLRILLRRIASPYRAATRHYPEEAMSLRIRAASFGLGVVVELLLMHPINGQIAVTAPPPTATINTRGVTPKNLATVNATNVFAMSVIPNVVATKNWHTC